MTTDSQTNPAEASETAPAAPEQTAPEQSAPAASPRVGIISQVLAGMKDKATLNAEIGQLAARNKDLEEQVLRLTTERDQALGEKQALEVDFAAIDQALKTAETTAQTVDHAAAAKIVEAGFTAGLPGSTDSQDEEETRETLNAKIAASTNDVEKWTLCEKLKALG